MGGMELLKAGGWRAGGGRARLDTDLAKRRRADEAKAMAWAKAVAR